MILSLTCVECVEIRYCELSMVWNGRDGCDFHDLWLVMLESAKD
jgi:hypothetical protein